MIQRQPLYAQLEHSGKLPSKSLGEVVVRRRAAKTKPPSVSTPCLKGKHFRCYKKDCACECHAREGKL